MSGTHLDGMSPENSNESCVTEQFVHQSEE